MERTSRRSILAGAAQAVLPARCAGCGAASEALCADCLVRAEPAPVLEPPEGLAWLAAPFTYDGPVREVVARVKYRNARTAIPWLADTVTAAVDSMLGERSPDVVTWPPALVGRRRARGFDHAELLARAVARRLGIPAVRLLRRSPLASGVQTGRPLRERREDSPIFIAIRPLGGQRVLVIDDVVTSGATITAASAALLARGASEVMGAAVARTPYRGYGTARSARMLKSSSIHSDSCLGAGVRQGETDQVNNRDSQHSLDHPSLQRSGSPIGSLQRTQPSVRPSMRVSDSEFSGERRVSPEVLRRLREEVASGAYEPPVEALVESMVGQLVSNGAGWPPGGS